MATVRRSIIISVLLTTLLNNMVCGNFILEMKVVNVHDPIDDCGNLEFCSFYIDEQCLEPNTGSEDEEDEDEDEDEEDECSLWKTENNFNLNRALPVTRRLEVTNKLWPVDFRMEIDITDYDFFNEDDSIEEIEFVHSLNTSTQFTEPIEFRNPNGRLTLTLQFKVQCSGGYQGPNCNCMPRDDDSGHYSCREDGGITCLPGYTNPNNFCNEIDYCVDVVCSPGTVCINNTTQHSCDPLPTNSPPPASSSPTVSMDNCTCPTGMTCTVKDGVYRCVCPDGSTRSDCSLQDGPTAEAPPRQDASQGGGDNRGQVMSAGVVAGVVVAGLIVALLVCLVLVVVLFVCIRTRKRKRWSKYIAKANGAPSLASFSTSSQRKLVENPTYEDSEGVVKPGSRDTLRELKNPLYTQNSSVSDSVENPLYRDHSTKSRAEESIYSVPNSPQTPNNMRGEDIYSVPITPPAVARGGEYIYSVPITPPAVARGGGDIYSVPITPPALARGGGGEGAGIYSYATVGTDTGKGDSTTTIGGPLNEYAIPTGPLPYPEAPYNTLDHMAHIPSPSESSPTNSPYNTLDQGLQQQQPPESSSTAPYNTLKYSQSSEEETSTLAAANT